MEIQNKNLVGRKIKSFNFIKSIGEGSFAKVYEVYDQITTQSFACKVIDKSQFIKTPKLQQLVRTQINVISKCNNMNVLKFKDSFENNQSIFIFTQLCNQGDLQQYLNNKSALTQGQAKYFLKQILNGFKGLHQVNALHRDLKLANIFLNNNVVKIADLGFAKILEEGKVASTMLGTSLTMAPQVLEGRRYNNKCDIWSIGVIYYQMLTGKYPYRANTDPQILKLIKTQKIEFPKLKNISQQSKDFILRCLEINVQKRISWIQMYNHKVLEQQKFQRLNMGVLKSNISSKMLQQNLNFYKNEEKKLIQYPQGSQSSNNIQFNNELDKNKVQLQYSHDFNKLKMESENKQKKSKLIKQLLSKYIERRNFAILIPKLGILPMFKLDKLFNHSLYAFLLCKKFYIEIYKFLQDLRKKNDIFNIGQQFPSLYNSDQYKKIIQITQNDMNLIIQQSTQILSVIYISNNKVLQQLTLQEIQTPQFKNMYIDILQGYFFILFNEFNECEQKNEILKLLEFLENHLQGIKQSSQKYEMKMQGINLNELEQKFRMKYEPFK